MALPKCGIYRTTVDTGGVPAGRLVYFHNHGDPGPGVYLPESWRFNRATFSSQGSTLPDLTLAATLQPLATEGLYRVEEAFSCCAKRCVTYAPSLLVQLGYNRDAQPLLFVPKWTLSGLTFPEGGQPIDEDRINKMSLLSVPEAPTPTAGHLH